MAFFIAFIMVASIMGFALMSYVPETPAPVETPIIIDHPITPEERVNVLRGGRVLIEYFYNITCLECVDKETMYRDFVLSNEFGGYLVLAHGVAENETSDWMLNLDGTQIDLSEINSTQGLRELFCDVALLQPNICILQDL